MVVRAGEHFCLRMNLEGTELPGPPLLSATAHEDILSCMEHTDDGGLEITIFIAKPTMGRLVEKMVNGEYDYREQAKSG